MSNQKRKRNSLRTGSIPSKACQACSVPLERMMARAVAHHQAGRLNDAEGLYRQILAMEPNHADSLHLLGLIAHRTGKVDLALQMISRSISVKPRNAAAHSNLGNLHKELGQIETALECFDVALALDPALADAWNNRGLVLHEIKDYGGALRDLDKAILLRPDYADAYINRSATLGMLHRYAEALESCNEAVRLCPGSAEAYCNRGSSLLMLGHSGEARDCFERAILLNPGYARAYSSLGSSLIALNQYQSAREICEKSISLDGNSAPGWITYGIALFRLAHYPDALTALDKAALLDPKSDEVDGLRLYVRRQMCLWENSNDQLAQLEQRIAAGERASEPFNFLVLSASPALQRKAAELHVQAKYSAYATEPASHFQSKHDRIRIGYYSADFHNHATSYLIAGLFEQHDKSRFELVAFSMGPDANDAMRERTKSAMDRFIDIRSMSDRQVAQLSRALEIDIAVDLKGFTGDNRHGIFAHRAAPIQVSFLGYPGTMGAPYIDYLVADHTVIPEDGEDYYSEKIVRLPNSYQVNDPSRLISPRLCQRVEEGLPEVGYVYCCFNNNYKITPAVFDVWMKILKRVEGSVLWLLKDNPWAADNLRTEAERRGVSAARLIFAARRPAAEHLARHKLADLFLDTLPCNAHTTASDALWAGLPVLTCMGTSFASRVAASLLRAVQLPELIAPSLPAYEETAVDCATIVGRCQELKARLAINRLTAPLFDLVTYTRELESAFEHMMLRKS